MSLSPGLTLGATFLPRFRRCVRLQNLLNRSTDVAAVWRPLSVLSANNLPGAKLRGNVVLCCAIAFGSALPPVMGEAVG